MDTENTAPVAPDTAPAAPAPAAPAAAPAEAKPAAEAKPEATPAVVDLLATDLAAMYPSLREMEEAAAKGLKIPVEKAWLDKQMEDPRFRGFAHNTRKLALKEREQTVLEKKAIETDRGAIAAERARWADERKGYGEELGRLKSIIESLPKPPEVPAGGRPDPKSNDPRVQQWHLQDQFAKMLEPARAKLAEIEQAQAKLDEDARHAAVVKYNEQFIAKTSDFHVYENEVAHLLRTKQVATIDAAYNHAKAVKLASTPVVAAKADTGPDTSKMTPTEITLYALAHPGWKPPRDAKYRASS